MTKTRPRTMLVLAMASLFSASITLAPTATAVGTCVNYEDDWGFGGSNVSCHLPCHKGAFLIVAGLAQDRDAGISAQYNCGGVGAGCTQDIPACADVSKYITNAAQDAYCWADSDEFWSSTVYVACAETGALPGGPEGDPMDKICKIFPNFPTCHGSGGSICDTPFVLKHGLCDNPCLQDPTHCPAPPSGPCDLLQADCAHPPSPCGLLATQCPHTIDNIAVTCVERLPQLWTKSAFDMVGLFPASFSGRDIWGLRSIAYYPDHTALSIHWDPLTGCTA